MGYVIGFFVIAGVLLYLSTYLPDGGFRERTNKSDAINDEKRAIRK